VQQLQEVEEEKQVIVENNISLKLSCCSTEIDIEIFRFGVENLDNIFMIEGKE
jgi:hypothetical protein